MNIGEKFEIIFLETNRYYEINRDGEIINYQTYVKDSNPGDITKGEKLNGSIEKPYKINCIEDLIQFSQNVNNGITYEGKYIVLERTLDFKSIVSYDNYKINNFGDLNGDGKITDLISELTTDAGFTPIGEIKPFEGNFNGQEYKIINLYEDRGEKIAGLFGINNGTIENLGLTNITLKGFDTIGGISAKSSNNSKISNCFVEGNTKIETVVKLDSNGNEMISNAGIISGYVSNMVIENCHSIGTIEMNQKNRFGGIVGFVTGNSLVKRCYNVMNMNVNTNLAVGGIVGWAYNGIIEECYHIGNIIGTTEKSGVAGGIIGSTTWKPIVKNCYNIGNIRAEFISGGIVGGSGADCFNCYSIGKITTTYCGRNNYWNELWASFSALLC